jgi:hypothetical protein
MSQNVGRLDATIRYLLAAALLAAAAVNNSRPLPAIALAVAALFVFNTAVNRRCPLYSLLGIRGPHGTPPPGA